ncbi:MAG: methyltransferase family protein [Candidatus Aquicultorales bacterium]
MAIIVLQIFGLALFLVSTVVLGLVLRRDSTKAAAEKTSKITHFFYYFGLMLPQGLSLFYPGLTRFDRILGIASLPLRPVSLVLGSILFLIGLYLTVFSMKAIKTLGEGAPAFKLSKKVVESDLYDMVRNPMALGYYMACFGLALAVGSTYLLLASVFITAIHIFYLKYFEELELEIRYGNPYLKYRASTPFILPKRGNASGTVQEPIN